MLYLGSGHLVNFGEKSIPVARMINSHANSIRFVNPTLYTFSSGNVNYQYRDSRMFRFYDYLNYNNTAFNIAAETPPIGGMEIECEYEPSLETTRWNAVFGARNGSTGYVTRINSLVTTHGCVGEGVGHLPEDNVEYGTQAILGTRVKERMIITPVLDQAEKEATGYTHAWKCRVIVKNVLSNKIISDEERYWGDTWDQGNNCLTSTITTFYRFFIGLGDRVRYAKGSSNAPAGSSFVGWIWNTNVYINPLGLDTNVPERALVTQIFPTDKGMYYQVYNISQVLSGIENPSIYRQGKMYAAFGGVMNQDVFYCTE